MNNWNQTKISIVKTWQESSNISNQTKLYIEKGNSRNDNKYKNKGSP